MTIDTLIRGGTIIDGTGAKAYPADIGISGSRIAAIGDLEGAQAKSIFPADGCIVAPGFIDSHSHSDTSFLADSSYASKLFQGITTEVSGQCGSSPFPALKQDENDPWPCPSFDEFVRRFEAEYSMAVNQAILVGHGSLRQAVIGCADRAAEPDELEQMKALLRRDLEAGAWGMSLGLEYAPGFFADTEELSALAGVVREYNGLVPCHMRSEGLHIDEAIDELISIGSASGAHVHISHLKLDNVRAHGRAAEIWKKIERARASGIDLSCDMYPFTASCTDLSIRCPKWSQEGGNRALVSRLLGSDRDAIKDGIREHYYNAERAETCLFCDDRGYFPEIVGKSLRYAAEELLHTEDYAEAAAEILVRTHGEAQCIFFVMSEKDMMYFLAQDIGIGSDGRSMSADPALVTQKPHPRYYATIPEFFRLARENGLCTIEEAVRRVTSKPADMIGLIDRGRLIDGNIADITVFDAEEITPRATYLDPIRTCAGIRHVFVGGEAAVADGIQTASRNGRFLRKNRT